jgi:hypothetical protein
VTHAARQPAERRRASESPGTLDLDVFEGDATLRFLAQHNIAPRVLLLIAPFFLLLLIVISAADGHLATGDLAGLWCQDIGHYLLSPNWPCMTRQSNSTSIPLFRDLSSLGCAVILGISPYLVYSQWLGIRDLYPAMNSQGLISFRDDVANAEGLFRREISLANQYFARAGRRSASTMASAAACMLLVVASQRYGVFPSLAPARLGLTAQDTWSKEAYAHWWANFDSAIAGWLAYFAIGTLGLYFIITMNVIGSRAVILVWRTRKLITYSADPDNRDGYYGWLQARKILAPTYIALALHGVGIFLVATMIPPDALWFLVPVGGQWLIVLGPYLYVPVSLIFKNITEYKRCEMERLTKMLDDLAAESMTVQRERDRETLAQRLERVRSIPALPFRRLPDVLLLQFTFWASAAAIYGAAALWYNIA